MFKVPVDSFNIVKKKKKKREKDNSQWRIIKPLKDQMHGLNYKLLLLDLLDH